MKLFRIWKASEGAQILNINSGRWATPSTSPSQPLNCLKLPTHQTLTLSFILTKSPQFGLCKTKKCSAPRIVEKKHHSPLWSLQWKHSWSQGLLKFVLSSVEWSLQQKSWSAQTSKTDDAPVRASPRGGTLNSADLREGYRMRVLVGVSDWVSRCVTRADPEFMSLLSQPSKYWDHTHGPPSLGCMLTVNPRSIL